MGLDTGVWVCIMFGMDHSVCRRVIDYHTRAILKKRTGAWLPPDARCSLKVGWFHWAHSILVKTLCHSSQDRYIIAINRFLSLRGLVFANCVLTVSHASTRFGYEDDVDATWSIFQRNSVKLELSSARCQQGNSTRPTGHPARGREPLRNLFLLQLENFSLRTLVCNLFSMTV